MKHIRQISKDGIYTIVVTDLKDLETHPCLETGLFEVVDCDIPENVQYLNYSAE